MTNQRSSAAVEARTLPDRPSLEHLKNEAKARQKALRAANPSVQLASCQRDLAREYGFSSWRQLKAHVAAAGARNAVLSAEEKIARLREEQARPRKKVDIDPTLLDRYIGFYELSARSIFTVRRENDDLVAALTGQSFFTFIPESDCKFFCKNSNIKAQLSFIVGDGERASALVLHQNGLEQRAERVDEARARVVEWEREERRREGVPAPGSEKAIRRLIKESLAGAPSYDLMSNKLARCVREQLVDIRRQLEGWGKLLEITFIGVAQVDGRDVFHVVFAGCRTEWRILMETSEVIGSVSYRPYP